MTRAVGEPIIRTRRWTRQEYDRLIELGVLREDEPIELLAGRLVVREPQHTPHATATQLAIESTRRLRSWWSRSPTPACAPIARSRRASMHGRHRGLLDRESGRPCPRGASIADRAAAAPGLRRHSPYRPLGLDRAARRAHGQDRRRRPPALSLPGSRSQAAAGISTVNSPRGGVAARRARCSAGVAVTISSYCLVSSRPRTSSTSPKTSPIAVTVATMRWGDS